VTESDVRGICPATRKLAKPIILKDRRAIERLSDARDLMFTLPESGQSVIVWQFAHQLLGEAANDKGLLPNAETQLTRALKAEGADLDARAAWRRKGDNVPERSCLDRAGNGHRPPEHGVGLLIDLDLRLECGVASGPQIKGERLLHALGA
jgi:hypothetical protein